MNRYIRREIYPERNGCQERNGSGMRTAIYKDEADYCHFLDIIKMTMKEYAFRVHSICMMTNHFHMEIETADVELWWIMQPFGPDYVPTELDWWWKDEPLINCPDRRVGVIGARRCTREDKEKCINRVKRIGEDNPGAIIISGGAKGIDGYAHTAAIKNGLRTIAFVGTGPDLCYPREHTELFEQIGEHGMILSEYPPGTAAYPSHFPRRNRLIAAWSHEMYVIGAGRNSGTRSTVQYFHEYHKEKRR